MSNLTNGSLVWASLHNPKDGEWTQLALLHRAHIDGTSDVTYYGAYSGLLRRCVLSTERLAPLAAWSPPVPRRSLADVDAAQRAADPARRNADAMLRAVFVEEVEVQEAEWEEPTKEMRIPTTFGHPVGTRLSLKGTTFEIRVTGHRPESSTYEIMYNGGVIGTIAKADADNLYTVVS